MSREVWIDGVRYVREDIPRPVYKVTRYNAGGKYRTTSGPFQSLADTTWQARVDMENGADSVVIWKARA